MESNQPLKKTALHDIHLSLNAKMMPFGGFDMPLQYEGIIVEHQATRESIGLFDTCHMGEFRFSGATALQDLENILGLQPMEINKYLDVLENEGKIVSVRQSRGVFYEIKH